MDKNSDWIVIRPRGWATGLPGTSSRSLGPWQTALDCNSQLGLPFSQQPLTGLDYLDWTLPMKNHISEQLHMP